MKNSAFKWLKQHKKSVMLAFVVVTLSVAIGCKREQSKTETVLDEPSNTEGVFKIAYDMETTSYSQLENPNSTPTAIENVGMMPKVKKSAIKMTVFEDGTSDWTIKDLEPVNKIIYDDKTPPSKEPKTVLTRIERSGLARFFDKDKNELHQFKLPIPDMKNFVTILKSDTSDAGRSLVGNSILSAKGGVNVQQILENAARNGAIVKNVSPNILSITIRAAISNGNVQTRTEQKIIESVIDTSQKVMLGSTVKTEQGQVLTQTYMKYNHSATNPTLEMMEQRVYDPNTPTSRRVVTIINNAFSNMQVIVH
jgi:hypothetical protein